MYIFTLDLKHSALIWVETVTHMLDVLVRVRRIVSVGRDSRRDGVRIEKGKEGGIGGMLEGMIEEGLDGEIEERIEEVIELGTPRCI